MTCYLLDTNILSNVAKPKPADSLLAWMADQRNDDLFIASLTLAEIRRGILEQPTAKRRSALGAWFEGTEGPPALFAGRILGFDTKAGLVWAQLMAEGRMRGRPRSALDMIIAAVAIVNGCVLVTDNERDFEGIELVNPNSPGSALTAWMRSKQGARLLPERR